MGLGEPDGRIFVTGGSGVVGRALLAELTPADGLLCLRHASELPGVPPEAQLAGDLSAPRLGLSEPAFRELARGVRCVVHAGADTRWTSDPAEIERTNRRGTETMLELAALADAPLHYVSTAFVPLGESAEQLAERSREAAARGSGLDAYLASKGVAERLVADSGLPGTVVRPSYIVGDSATGRIARFQGLYRVVSLALRNMIPAVPVRPDAITDFIPQDLLARTVAAIVRADLRAGTLWVTAGERTLRAGEFLDLAMDLAERLGLEAQRPRLMSPDVVDRLIRPVFMARLPEAARRPFEEMLSMTALLGRAETLPDSADEIASRLGVDVAFDPREVLERSLTYWATEKGLVAPEAAGR